MSKVICDICGTAFAETANQCPICGTAKSESARPTGGDEAETGYAYVKGGRFSQANVRKYNSGKQELPRTVEEKPRRASEEETVEDKPQRPSRKKDREEPENEQPSNIGLIIIVVVLLLAIISLCAYIAIRYINMNNDRKATEGSSTASSSSDIVQVPCTGISIIGVTEHTFSNLTDELWLQIECQPANTTDLVTWDYDQNIVDVQKIGNQWVITPVGSGETVVTVTCGGYSDTLNIVCDLTEIPVSIVGPESHTFSSSEPLRVSVNLSSAYATEELTWSYDESIVTVTQEGEQWVITPVGPGQTTVTVNCGEHSDSIEITSNVNISIDPEFVLEWACDSDITLTGYGARWRIYNGSVDVSKIVFNSSDETVATVENGYVYIWKNGNVTITAAYGNQVITMIVRARNVVVPENPVEPDYFLYTTYGKLDVYDITISVGESLTISLRDKDGIKVTEGVTFSVSDDTIISVNENGRVTGIEGGRAYIYVEYEGVVYECLVRVKVPAT